MALIRPRAGNLGPRSSSRTSILTRASSLLSSQKHETRRYFTQQQQQALAAKRMQIYRSTTADPYLNLSIEHYLLQHSHPDSTVLFLYINRPCVVIGRNQNPWLEVNLPLLRQGVPARHNEPAAAATRPQTRPVALVRRRSGGGTVFHDEGNVNWSVICPPSAFNRDTHAEMVVRAMRTLGIASARVNERHDIVLDDTTTTTGVTTYKVSGSAYKLTRQRSLHHGTCLLASPNLARISALLRSPAEPFVKARGVESVRSKVRNVGLANGPFVEAVVGQFRAMYGAGNDEDNEVIDAASALDTPEIFKGVRELMSPEWIYGQTPQFTFSTHPTEDDPRERPALPNDLPTNFRLHLTARHGEIQEAAIGGLGTDQTQDEQLSQALLKQNLLRIPDWTQVLRPPGSASDDAVPEDVEHVGRWLNGVLGTSSCNDSDQYSVPM
ncbi:hypothetical protein B0T22DRAFT_411341 [Podospora appendiculata]|uniref:Putative lipoate-protein ligase A n=1 Tax=Podospora appendiculata TaxID=314037 RepID=A0AAE0X235_9PEZI|nr:hypothetical protein B0T22DRAFT_411341 [Podospora appendiculata]